MQDSSTNGRKGRKTPISVTFLSPTWPDYTVQFRPTTRGFSVWARPHDIDDSDSGWGKVSSRRGALTVRSACEVLLSDDRLGVGGDVRGRMQVSGVAPLDEDLLALAFMNGEEEGVPTREVCRFLLTLSDSDIQHLHKNGLTEDETLSHLARLAELVDDLALSGKSWSELCAYANAPADCTPGELVYSIEDRVERSEVLSPTLEAGSFLEVWKRCESPDYTLSIADRARLLRLWHADSTLTADRSRTVDERTVLTRAFTDHEHAVLKRLMQESQSDAASLVSIALQLGRKAAAQLAKPETLPRTPFGLGVAMIRRTASMARRVEAAADELGISMPMASRMPPAP